MMVSCVPPNAPTGLGGAGATGQAGSGTVLVVEDTASVLSILTMMLRRRGYQTMAAGSAEEALEMLVKQKPDVILTDIDLPGMSGIALCRLIHDVVGQPIHVIMISGHIQQVVPGLDAGADDFVCKPFKADELLARIEVGLRSVQRQKSQCRAANKLQHKFDTLRENSQRTGRELDDAAELQSAILPPPMMICNGVVVSCKVKPERILSGDMVGLIACPSGNVALYAIDVSGCGTPAALLATSLAIELRRGANNVCPNEWLPGVLSPTSEIIARLNNDYVDVGSSERYSTIAYAMLNAGRRLGEVCVAGHPCPALVSADGTVRFLGDGGPAVGLHEDARYGAVGFEFGPGDRLVLYSDGLLESRLPGGSLVGYQGMAELLGSLTDIPNEAVSPALIDALSQRLGHRPSDDVSVIAAAYDGLPIGSGQRASA